MINNVKMNVDPAHHYGPDMRRELIEACGIIPQFVFGTHDTMAKNMEENYEYFLGDWKQGDATIDEEGRFCFPGDPPLVPLMSIVCNDEVVFIYSHAIVAVIKEGEPMKWTRMD